MLGELLTWLGKISLVPWWVAALISNAAIARVEYLNRVTHLQHFPEQLLHTAPWILLAQWGLFHCWRGAPDFMLAWAFFTTGNLLARLVNAYFFVGEPLSLGTWLGTSVIVCGMIVVKYSH